MSYKKWNEIRPADRHATILIGNGFSQSIWAGFSYRSLHDLAVARGLLSGTPEQNLFEEYDTKNFEEIMLRIRNAGEVNHHLNEGGPLFQENYNLVKESLLDAVHSVHPEFSNISPERLLKITRDLKNYASVYTTNYDLILYWAMLNDSSTLCDMFWSSGSSFDADNAEIWGNKVPVYFLHGALHLYRDKTGTDHKILNDGSSLLSQVGNEPPLFVSEGRAKDKKRSIRSSEYLSYCMKSFEKIEGGVIILGQSLGEQDSHILNTLKSNENKITKLCIGIYNPTVDFIEKKRAWLAKLSTFDENKIEFFDSATHPLTAPEEI